MDTPYFIAVGGPSGSGKTRLVTSLIRTYPDKFTRPTSFTTRPRRQDEGDDEYIFSDLPTIDKMNSQGELVNYDEVYGHVYAMTRQSVREALASGLSLIKEIHPLNYGKLRVTFPDLITVLLLPYSQRAPHDPERTNLDDAFYEDLDQSTFDIVLGYDAPDDSLAVAHLARAITARRSYDGLVPRSQQIDALNMSGYTAVAPEFTDELRITTTNFHDLTLQFFASELQTIEPGAYCVEIGPGRGWLTRQATDLWPTYHLVDITNEMLSRIEVPVASKCVATARLLPFPTETVDVVLGSLADPWLYPEALCEIRRVLRRGGQFIFTVPSARWASGLRGTAPQQTVFSTTGGPLTVWSFTYSPETLEDLLAKCGFRVQRFESFTGHDLLAGKPISPAITMAAAKLDCAISDLELIHAVVCEPV